MIAWSRTPRTQWTLAVLLLPCLGWVVMSGGDSTTGKADVPSSRSAPRFRWQGVSSCAATACHHNGGPRGDKESEYSTWIEHDPHARAYDVLHNARSKRIAKLLALPRPAHEHGPCLSCHVGPHWQEAQANPRFSLRDGVGCESCHGPAERWLNTHHQPGWRRLTQPQKLKRGMTDTKSIPGRARTCVACHVGSPEVPGMEVTHDLIAAGHPRLHFELAGYHGVYPRHWKDEPDAVQQLRLWASGQVVSAEAALSQLEHRAHRAETWPEFAEHDCLACHHRLGHPAWPQADRDPRRRPGTAGLNRWHFSMLPHMLQNSAKPVAPGVAEALATLDEAMARPVPDRRAVAKLSAALRRQLDGQAARLANGNAGELRGLIAAACKSPSLAGHWDSAAQLYLALAASERGKTSVQLRLLSRELRFERNELSPRRFDPRKVRKVLELEP